MTLMRATGAKTAIFAAVFLAAPAAELRAEDGRPFHFAVMGCAHTGVCGSKDFALAAARMKEQKPDFVVFLGGMVDIPARGGVEAQWREFDAVTAKIGAPVHNVPGACRRDPLLVDKDKAARAAKGFDDRHKKRFYSFKYRNSLFICLDSDSAGGPDGSRDGALSAEQLEFLKKEVAGSAGSANVFLFLHNAQWLRENLSKRLAGVYPLLLKKVKYVFSAKDHSFSAEQIDGLSYITTGAPPCAPKPAGRPVMLHFLDIAVDGDGPYVSLVPINGVPIEKFASGKGRKSGRSQPAAKSALMDSDERKLMLPVKPILAAMEIKPGMRIADVGAGTGIFAFPLAGALNGTGMVYATDTEPDMVGALKRTAWKKGYTNITAVLVSVDGADQFYKTQTFDIMLFSELYQYLADPAAYFRELRPSLAKETGRVYIIHFRNVPDFGEMEFGDFTQALKILRKGANIPTVAKAGAGLEEVPGAGPGDPVPQAARERILKNLNALLADPRLAEDLMSAYGQADPAESPERGAALLKKTAAGDLNLARWLLTELEAEGVFKKKAEELTAGEKKRLKALNRILLAGVFKLDKLDFIKGVYPVYAEKEKIVSDMEAAGYKLVRGHDFLTYHHFMEFQ